MKTAELIADRMRPAEVFPSDGRRLLIYVVYDPRGDIEDYICYALERLRSHCDEIMVVVNGELTEQGHARLRVVADEIIERENRGFDIWGYKAGLDAVGQQIGEFDELLLVNDTWFGPVRPFEPVFERMNGRELHFWGMTDHMRVDPNPFTGTGYLPYHLQSYWLSVRKSMFLSEEWKEYWRELPEMSSYSDAVVKHESTFTERFTDDGFIGEVAFPTLTDKVENHAVLYAEQLLDEGCPTLKRRPFFQWPAFMDTLGVVGRWTVEAAEKYGYPSELIYSDLARNVAPRVLHTDAAMMEVLSERQSDYDASAQMRILVVAHIFYVEMTDEIIDLADNLPGTYSLIVTTPDKGRATRIRDALSRRQLRGEADVRVVDSNEGRDQSAFLIGCREELRSGDFDLVVKLHSKKTPQDGQNVGAHFKRQQFENLLRSKVYAANVVSLFQKEAGLGIVFPPMVHLGYPTLGHAWWANREPFIELANELGVRVPVDEQSPLAPYGSMFIARPEALKILVDHKWSYRDFSGAYDDGSLAHVLERMPVYAAGELGYHSRTIANRDYFASSYTALEFELDQISIPVPGDTMERISILKRIGYLESGSLREFILIVLRRHRPSLARRAETVFARLGRSKEVLRRLAVARVRSATGSGRKERA